MLGGGGTYCEESSPRGQETRAWLYMLFSKEIRETEFGNNPRAHCFIKNHFRGSRGNKTCNTCQEFDLHYNRGLALSRGFILS